MSITSGGVKFKRRKTATMLLILTVVESIFSVLLVVSLSANFLFPQRVDAIAGVSTKLSYQGRLTDLSGNTLGGATGTNYCFQFTIWDSASGGAQQWPSTTVSNTTAKVKDGVFNTDIGTNNDLSTFNFANLNPLYLQVKVAASTGTAPGTCSGVASGSFETLDLRQQIESVGYARAAEGVYSALLRAPTAGTAVQIGTGAGATTPIFFNLDVKNADEAVGASCSTNGQLWYNSFDSKSRICEAGAIQDLVAGFLVRNEGADIGRASKAIDFTGAGAVVSKGSGANSGVININIPFGGVAVNAAGTINSGVIVFSNSNNIVFGINGSTVTASANVAGGGGATISHWPPFPVGLAVSTNNTGATAAGTNVTASFYVAPLQLPSAISFSRINVVGSYISSVAGTGSVSLAHMLGIYTLNGGTALSLSTSYMFRQEISQNSVIAQSHRWYWGTNSTSNSSSTAGALGSLFNSLRNLPLFQDAAGGSLSAGQYYMVYAQTNRSTSVNVFGGGSALMYVSGSQTGLIGNQLGSAATRAPFPLIGLVSSTTAVGNFTSPFMPSSINTTAITNTGGSTQWRWPFVNFAGK